jgi:hypothetical protein
MEVCEAAPPFSRTTPDRWERSSARNCPGVSSAAARMVGEVRTGVLLVEYRYDVQGGT